MEERASAVRIWTVADLLRETRAYFEKCGIATARLDAELLLGFDHDPPAGRRLD